MGSAYPTIAADVISRYQKLQGKEVTFVTGSDEYGEKIATTAAGRCCRCDVLLVFTFTRFCQCVARGKTAPPPLDNGRRLRLKGLLAWHAMRVAGW